MQFQPLFDASYFGYCTRGKQEKMDTSLEENVEKVLGKGEEGVTESHREINNSMPGFELISENEKKVQLY